MAESSETESVSSFQIEPSSEEKAKRFYALYLFNSNNKNRGCSNNGDTGDFDVENEEESTCLNIAATNLPAQMETDLRKSISLKLTYKTRPYEEGHVYSLGLTGTDSLTTSACCYYCVVRSSSDSMGFNYVNEDGNPGSVEDSDCQQFVICFLSFQESSLDLFRTELDEYTKGLIPLLDKEHPEITMTSFKNDSSDTRHQPSTNKELSQLSEGIHDYLEQWPPVVLGFLTRTMQCMESDISQLIYAALLNANVQVSGASKELEQDIKKFIQSCSLSGLLERPESLKNETEKDSSDNWQLQPITVSVVVDGDSVTFDKIYNCQFCKNAADKLVAQDKSNVTKMREILESVKLSFAHNLNKLKRFLSQGEVDFYALYRALSYLRNTGCGDLLLRYVKMGVSLETLNVVGVIETLINEKKPPLS